MISLVENINYESSHCFPFVCIFSISIHIYYCIPNERVLFYLYNDIINGILKSQYNEVIWGKPHFLTIFLTRISRIIFEHNYGILNIYICQKYSYGGNHVSDLLFDFGPSGRYFQTLFATFHKMKGRT